MGFFAVLAASLFAVFLFTVFGGYSLLLWCIFRRFVFVCSVLFIAVCKYNVSEFRFCTWNIFCLIITSVCPAFNRKFLCPYIFRL